MRAAFCLGALCLTAAGLAQAGNGLNTIGSGTESVGMGGADVAVARDSAAVNINPAGLVQIERRALDAELSLYHATDAGHADALGNDQRVENTDGGIIGVSYAGRLGHPDLVAGIGLFAVGGSGFVYKDLQTGYGTRDDFSSLFSVLRLAPAIAWQASEQLSLGATLGLSYAAGRQKLFPNTSFVDAEGEQAPFFGARIDGVSALGFSGKFGLQWRASDALTLALVYSTKTPLDLKGGTLTLNMEAAGLGRVRYGEASISGLALAQQLDLGLALRPHRDWLLALDLTWLDWSSAMRATTLEVRNPDNNQAPAEIREVTPLNWRDQYIIALGASYQLDDRTRLRAGYNYGRNPVSPQALTPLLALITEHHITGGFSRRLSPQWDLGMVLQWQLLNSVRYDNPALPITQGARDTLENIFLHFMLSRRW